MTQQTHIEELLPRKHLGTVSKKTTGILKPIYSLETSPLIRMRLQFTDTRSVRIEVLYLICAKYMRCSMATPLVSRALSGALFIVLGPVVQSVVSLTSSLRAISLTILGDSIYNFLKIFAEKMWKLLTFFQQKISAYLRITRCKF